MVKLEPGDRQQLLRLLEALPDLDTIKKRRDVLRSAGLDDLIPRLDLSDPPRAAITEMVDYLSEYGRTSRGYEALGSLLSIIQANFVGLEKQSDLAELISKYGMMMPAAVHPIVSHWRGNDSDQQIQEKIVGENTLRPVAFLTQGARVAGAVALVHSYGWSGTGFLISPDLLITNQHVLPDPHALRSVRFRFHYEETWRGELRPYELGSAKAGGIFHSEERLDYTVVELEGRPGDTCGWLELVERNVRLDERVNIIQHAGGLPKQVSMQNNFVQYVDDTVIQYVTSTLPGSSGSPVLNDRWEVVALHHAGGLLSEPRTGKRYFRNEGIRIGKILESLPVSVLGRLAFAEKERRCG